MWTVRAYYKVSLRNRSLLKKIKSNNTEQTLFLSEEWFDFFRKIGTRRCLILLLHIYAERKPLSVQFDKKNKGRCTRREL